MTDKRDTYTVSVSSDRISDMPVDPASDIDRAQAALRDAGVEV